MSCEWNSQRCFKLLRIFNILVGAYLIANGVLRFILMTSIDFKKSLLSIYYILFGIIVLLTELNFRFVINQFSFQETYFGRGLFLIFIGVLCFDTLDTSKIGIINLVCGSVTCANGVICVLSSCYAEKKSQSNYQAPPQSNLNKI